MTVTETLKRQLESGAPLSRFAVAKLRAAGNESALKANAQNIVKLMLKGDKVTSGQLEEVKTYFPEQAEEYVDAGGAVKEDNSARDSCSAIARRIGITQQALYKLLNSHDDAPAQDENGKYNVKETIKWYTSLKVGRAVPKTLKEQALAEDVRLKRAKANIAEGKAIPTDEVQELFVRIYHATWQVLKQNARRYGTDYDEAIRNARADFTSLRERLKAICSLDSQNG